MAIPDLPPPSPPSPPVTREPAPPTVKQLETATPEQARQQIDALTPEGQKALKTEVDKLPVAEREHLINGLAGKLEAPQLTKLEPVFGKDSVKQAVESHASATVREDYARQSPGGSVTQKGNQVTVETSDNDDNVRVSRDAQTGDVTVNVNGQEHRYSAAQAEHITIRTHGGNDVIGVAPDMQVNFSVEGGDGNDIIAGGAGADTLDGGAGDDRIIGGLGSDRMIGGSGSDNLGDSSSLLDISLLSRGIVPRSGGGNDVIEGGDGIDTIKAGSGDDKIDGGAEDDKIDAGEGQDVVAGGKGDDYLDGFTGHDQFKGGVGADTIYGGEGDDNVDGGEGEDYLDGYLGNDSISGGDGKDVVSGGQGEDSLFGDKGDDVIYTGAGRDFVGDFDGTNAVYYQGEDNLSVNDATRHNAKTVTVEIIGVPDTIQIEGSPEFQARMRADLETLAASPTGQQMLKDLDKQGNDGGFLWFDDDNKLTIRELKAENGKGGGQFGGDGFAEINPAFHLDDDDGRVPPITVLYHELAHARAAMSDHWAGGQYHDNADPNQSDDGIENGERQAVGLPVDHDNDPKTAAVPAPDTPAALTENAIREEMGYGPRNDYR
ncbi:MULTISPECIES: M91 family zinc metallopeptidase [Lysobacter]|uniref:M91 family zinc metallopeptidase n=1 Tax=Lysobacter TaxID=68 RepID=UPI001F1BFC65|nr:MULTISPECIES: M91 family zinc metallopeptidase [Lysobacter]UJB20038.1 M91 family zinc metallopeptidase [Lysobacter capsici]UJQ30847.1 M91 family zinc metallopeptidase [Lysobacter gummosus]